MDFRKKLSSRGESFSEGTSRFFSSVIAKKNGLMTDLSNKIESVGTSLMHQSSSGSLSDSDGPVFAEAKVHRKRPDSSPEEKPDSPTLPMEMNPKQKHLKNKENLQRASSLDRNQNGRMSNLYNNRQGSFASSSSDANEESNSVTGFNMSFDEPIYSPRSKSSTPERKQSGVGPKWKGKKTPPPIPPPPFNPNKTGRRSSTNSPKMSSGHSSDSEKYERYASMEKNAEVNVTEKVVPDEKSKAPTFASTKRRSSTVDEMLFDDYIEPLPEVVNAKPVAVDDSIVVNKRKTLLPMGDLISFDEPELEDFHPKQHKNNVKQLSKNSEKSRDRSYPSVSSTCSSEYIYDETDQDRDRSTDFANQESVESSEPEYERSFRRMDSAGSVSSNYSLDSQPDDLTLDCMSFMKQFVSKMFDPRSDITQVEKSHFGEYCQQIPGRQWFARYVQSQRVVSRKVEESIFFRLVQYFAVMLFECNESEDYVPAKTLMNMCFTFYHESRRGKQRFKNFLYSYLREQPIWQSLRFWNAAFFDAVQNERARKPVCTSEDDHDFQTDDSMFQENITFGQLGTFTCNMQAFGLNRDLCLEFLRKQSTIADLKQEQIKMLKENIDKYKDH